MIELEKSNCRKKIYEEKISRSRKTKLQWNSYNTKLMYSIIQPFRNRCLDAYLYAPNQIKYENLISFNSIRKLKS